MALLGRVDNDGDHGAGTAHIDRRSRRDLLLATASTATALGSAGCLAGTPADGDGRTIEAPARTPVGDPAGVRLVGFGPDMRVTLEAVATDARGVTYDGSWALRTDGDGRAALADVVARTEATDSAWYGPADARRIGDRSGFEMLLHRLSPPSPAVSPPTFVTGDRRTVDVALRARTGPLGHAAVRRRQRRVYLDPEIEAESVRAAGVVGRLYTPSTAGSHSPVVTFHGAHGVLPRRLSRLLATQGYATLALRYFDGPGLPDSLVEVPVEYFQRAIAKLTGREGVRDDGVGLVGFSQGVGAALLAGVAHDGPVAVVGYSGGGVVSQGVSGVPPRRFVDRPAWTRDGDPVVPTDAADRAFDAVRAAYEHRCDPDAAVEVVTTELPAELLGRALVPVEEIDGPVLFLAGADDGEWPSVPSAALAVRRLRRHDHPHPYGLRAYCECGHSFGVPYADYHGIAGGSRGGTPAANARAAAESWPLALGYLERGLGRREASP
ncbi:acyl-CoA thioester hydrolase/BAAT C-terminal domain-containing protein [Halobium salinum]|uniref:Acyl-CoA thioester hydrolase/BAAT C-terminal domain-containing protein n=1 Tax=Halobium salinum TaxID=1364940 RepID=A0ABD5PD45_9EURY|nr:acyl-CoA thioester hydrolase/BAAT C-terminal domain-containing protein [Halobium salinum]